MERQSEEGFLKAIAERPHDRALRSIFCDWLLEQGDPRGEAMALWEKGELSFTERRRLEVLQARHGRLWLGPLAAAVRKLPESERLGRQVTEDCTFAGGLLSGISFPANLSAERYAELTGEPRLATVESLCLEPGRVATEVGGFLADPVLAGVVTLESDVGTLLKAQGYSFCPQVLKVRLWEPRDDLSRLAAYAPLKAASVLQISTVEYVTPEVAEELADAVFGSRILDGRKRLDLGARHATIEGVVRWLQLANARARGPLDTLVRWGVDYAETQLGREGERFEEFMIDMVAKDAREDIGRRLGTATTVLALLGPTAGIEKVEVRHVPGGRLSKDELNTVRGSLRRLPGLKEFRVAGVLQSP